jgi:hypothetical protein
MRTANHFIDVFSKHGDLVPLNPMRSVDKIDAWGCQRIDRRALTDEELRKVSSVDEYRGMVYLVAAQTGFSPDISSKPEIPTNWFSL